MEIKTDEQVHSNPGANEIAETQEDAKWRDKGERGGSEVRGTREKTRFLATHNT